MKRPAILGIIGLLVLGIAGYTAAQMGPGDGRGMMGGPMMGQGMMGQGMMGGMGPGMMGRLSDEQLKAMAQMHGMTPEQMKQMVEQCQKMMGTAGAAPEQKGQ